MGLHPLGRSAGKVAAVKPSHAARGHLPVRPGQVGLAQAIARRRHGRQALQEDDLALGEQRQLGARLLQAADVVAVEPESLLGDSGRGLQKTPQRQASVVGAGVGERGKLTGNADRQGSILTEERIGLALAQEQVACGRGRGHLAAIQSDQPPVG